MKIKQDFVTNSSSVSFCAWGIAESVCLDYCKLSLPEKLLKNSYSYYLEKIKKSNYTPLMRRINKKIISYEEFCEKIRAINYDYTDYIIGYLNTLGIESVFSYDDNAVYIGRSPFSMEDDETVWSFKNILKLDLINIGFENPDIVPICEEIEC